MIVNKLGKYCETYLQNLEAQRSTIEIHEFIIMPNHVHILLFMSEFKPSMNQEYVDYRQERRDALLGRPSTNNTEHINIQSNNEIECSRDALLGRPDTDNKIENGHAKSMSLQLKYNTNYQ